jgi:NAD(P)-dependent dehydrogenase (short-subunit alcohol dehydrogenase family)
MAAIGRGQHAKGAEQMMHPLFDLTGRVALVSGAGNNLGRSTAIALAEAGADLMICGRHIESLEETAHEISKLGRRAVPWVCDVAEIDQIRAMFQQLDKEFGKIDILSAVPGNNKLYQPEDVPMEEFVKTLQSVLVGKFCCCQEAGRRMLKQGKGSIMAMSSIAGLSALGRGNFSYSVGMGGVVSMVRELSTAWAGRGVRVNGIAPAQITNDGLEERMNAQPKLRATFLHGLPVGRLGVPDDIKGLSIFLASDASAFITGTVFPLDGGNMAMNSGGTHGAPIPE